MRSFLLLSLLSCSGLFAAAQPAASRVYFEPNRGQTDSAARFVARVGPGTLLFTNEGVALRRAGSETAVQLEFVGASRASRWAPGAAAPGTTSYIVGRDRSQWIKNVPHYERLLRRGVYPGIDAAWHGDAGRFEYDFVVAPGADPSRIAIRARGAARLRIDPDGGLTIETAAAALRQRAPEVYQTRSDGSRTAVAGRFRFISRDTVGFAIGAYDRTRPLTIDPVLESSTYLGGNGEDRIVATGGPSRYVGTTTSIDFPGAAFERRGGKDIVVNTGAMTWVIGGSGDEEVTAAYVPLYGDIAVVGYTNSKDLPTNMSTLPRSNPSPKIFQSEYAGGASDGFFFWISDNGSAYTNPSVYLTYIGTPGDDRLTGVSGGYPFSGYAMVGYTDGQGLPSPPNELQGLRDAPAGGVDGFLIVATNLAYTPSVGPVTYFGGSGDDRPAAIYTTTGGYLIAGETTSPDFPLGPSGTGALQGPSDAFVLQITVTGSNLAISGGALIGGSGPDRATAITQQNGAIVVAGATSSPDLPVKSPVQASYGGGESDVFLARIAGDFSQTLFLTYVGGSGADEASSLATDFLGNLFVGGWTASTDFPVRNPAQAAFGGGTDDAILLHFTQDGSLYAATYFGGAGSDRILGVYSPGDHSVWVAGQTSSPDLPTVSARQSALAGVSDGFLARTSAALLTAFRPIGAKGLRGQASVYIGPRNGSVDAAVTVTSLNPSNVLVSSGNGPAQASVVLSAQYYPSNARIYGIDCQVESGGADLTISADGYPSQTVHADCFPIQARVATYSAAVFYYDQNRKLTTNPWLGGGQIAVALYAVNPALPSEGAALYSPDGNPLTVQPQSSDPSILKAAAGPPLSNGQISISAQSLSIGNAAISFSAPGFTVANTLPVAVVSPLSITDTAIAAGFELGAGIYAGRAPDGTIFTITSDDPSRLVVSTDPGIPGSASTTSNSTVYFQALAPGDVTVHVSATGVDPVSSVVHVQAPVVFCTGCARRLDLGVKQSQYVALQVGVGSHIYPYMTPNPGTTLHFTFDSSMPGVASVSPATYDWKGGGQSYSFTSLSVAGVTPGDSNLVVHAPDGFTVDAGASFPIHVGRGTPRVSDVDAGKDLATTATYRLPSDVSGPMTLTIADPSLALLSIDNRSAGQKSLSMLGTGTFYVQGLADSGTTTITATGPGFDPVTATVRLGPAGYIWSTDSVSVVQYSSAPSVYISPYALDAATLIPVAPGNLRYGVTAAPQVKSSDTGVAAATGPDNNGVVTLATKGVGTATVSIVQPPGFTAPAERRDLNVTVRAPSLQLYGGTVGKDLQAATSISIPYGASGTLTLTSSDPSKLLLATDVNTPGAASITMPASQNNRLYLQGLDNSGQAVVTASMPGFVDGSAVFTLAPAAVVMNSSAGGAIATTTQSGKMQLSLSIQVIDPATGKLLGTADAFRPGISGPNVTVTSSDPAVGTISRSPATVGAGHAGGSVDFVPLTPGDTVLTVVQPPGYVAPATGGSITAHVTSPGFTAVDFTMARDTISGQTVQLGGGVLSQASNLEVTITSGDPSKLVLSDTPEGPAGASVKKVLVAGRYATDQYYVQALDKQGVVPLTISAPGFADTTVKVTLSDLVFQFGQGGGVSTAVRALIQNGPQKYTISFRAGTANAVGYIPQLPVRPGAAPILVNVSSSDPTILAVDTPQISVAPGATSSSVTVHPVSIGTAVLLLDVPGYTVDKTGGYLAVSVEGARLSLGYNAISLGRDLQTSSSVTAEVNMPAGTAVTIASSDPSRLLISTDAKTPGQGSVTVTAQAFQQPQVWLQALADNGSVTVTASADGYQPTSPQVTLVPSAAIFGTTGAQTLNTNSRPQTVYVYLAALDPVSLRQLGSNGTPRPGVNLTTTVSVSDKSVLATDVTSINFAAPNNQYVQVRPVGPGTAVLSLGALPGGVSPGAPGQLAYSVVEPDVYFAEFTIGRDMQAPSQLKLGSRVPTPSSDLALTVSPGFSTFTVATGGTVAAYPNVATVIIPAGQRVSRPFTVLGLSTGANTLVVSGPGITTSTSFVTVVDGTFIFQEGSPAAVSTGASTNLTVVPALLPLGTVAPPAMALRDGVSPIAISVTTTNSSILSVTPPAITFKSGDSQATVSVKGLAPGSGTVSLNAPAYGIPNAKSTMNVIVK